MLHGPKKQTGEPKGLAGWIFAILKEALPKAALRRGAREIDLAVKQSLTTLPGTTGT